MFHAHLPASSEGPALLGRQGPLPPGADAELVVPPGSGGRLPGWETRNEDAVDGRGSGRGRLSQRQAGSSKEVNRRRAGPARSRFRAAACQTAGAEPPSEEAAAGQAQTLGRWWPWTRSSHVTAVWVRSSSFRWKWRPCPESQASSLKGWRAQRVPASPTPRPESCPGLVAPSALPVTHVGTWHVCCRGGSQAVAQPFERYLTFLSPSPGDPRGVQWVVWQKVEGPVGDPGESCGAEQLT